MSHGPERFLEITLLSVRPPTTETVSRPAAPAVTENAKKAPKKQAAPPPKTAKETLKPGKAPFDESAWADVLQALKKHHNTLYGVVRMARPTFIADTNTLRLSFAFAFHEKRIKEAANRQKLADIIYELTGRKVEVECTVDAGAKPPKVALEAPQPAAQPPAGDLKDISNIFGAAELLES